MCKGYVDLIYTLNKLQWENYIDGKNHDLNIICNKKFDYIEDMLKRKKIVLARNYIREWIDKSMEVSVLVNKLDDFDNYINGAELSKEDLADKIYPDVISLMKIRDSKSIEIGFKGYQNAIIKSDSMTYETLINWLHNYLENNLENANIIIDKYNLKWKSWFSDLDRICDLQYKSYDAYEILYKFAEKMDILDVIKNVKIYCDKSLCYATKLDKDDIRISVGDINSLNQLRTLFHEFGHAILYYYSGDSYVELTHCLNEAFAVIIENLAPIVVLSEDEALKINDLNCLEYTRTAISGLFELELWNDVTIAEKLYIEYFSKLNIEIDNPKLWCLDSFRSIDCMYIYNYTLGQLVSEHFIELLNNNYKGRYKEYGNMLKKICRNINEITYADLFNIKD